MSRLFLEDGESVPVTAVSVCGNFVADIRTTDKNGYNALVVSKTNKHNHLKKSQKEFFKKIDINPGSLAEFKLDDDQAPHEIGDHLTADIFEVGQHVDVTGISKGKGYAGVIKRHNFAMQDATHGNSLSHRALGSTGQCQDPGRVFKGKKMPGQLGNVKNTIQNLVVVKIVEEDKIMLVKGSVPGFNGSNLIIKPTRKNIHQKKS